MAYSPQSKGTGPKNAKYAHGGCEITTRSIFYKSSPDPFKDDDEITDYKKSGKGGTLSKLTSDPAKAVKQSGKAEEASESGAERRREMKTGEE